MVIVGEQADHLSRLVDTMFLLSRAEAHGLPLSLEPVYIDDLVAESARAVQVLAHDREVAVTADGDAEVPFTGDNSLLRQMVTNLLDNAVRHATAGGEVSASVRQTQAVITIQVIDDGPGVPVDARERIFQRFTRLGHDYAGAGLGLPIARWIAEAHGGSLLLQSTGRRAARSPSRYPALRRRAASHFSRRGMVQGQPRARRRQRVVPAVAPIDFS